MAITRNVAGRELRLVQGDITDEDTDAIVNAANQHLAGGGGVDGAIHRRGGPTIMTECRQIGGCPTGDAVATGGGRLLAKHVIHAVAPRWRGGGHGEAELLASAYRRSLEVADEVGARSVSFPSLGTGAYGYPVEEAAYLALNTVLNHLHGDTGVEQVRFVLFSAPDLTAYAHALKALEARD